MQRINKFRVFHKPTGKMFYPTDDLESILHYNYIQHNDQLVLTMDGKVALYHCDRAYLRISRDFIPLEYIGRKDENDKEIYEGDIMSPKEYLKHYGNQVIKWSDDSAGFIFGEDLSPDECEEVIGNIYENKELKQG